SGRPTLETVVAPAGRSSKPPVPQAAGPSGAGGWHDNLFAAHESEHCRAVGLKFGGPNAPQEAQLAQILGAGSGNRRQGGVVQDRVGRLSAAGGDLATPASQPFEEFGVCRILYLRSAALGPSHR